MLIPIDPIPVAMAAAVLVAVLLAVLVPVDETDMAVGLVDVANVVAVESIAIDIPDIVAMSISDISMFSLLLVIKISGRLSSGHESNGSQASVTSSRTGGINVKKWRAGRIGLRAGCERAHSFWSLRTKAEDGLLPSVTRRKDGLDWSRRKTEI